MTRAEAEAEIREATAENLRLRALLAEMRALQAVPLHTLSLAELLAQRERLYAILIEAFGGFAGDTTRH